MMKLFKRIQDSLQEVGLVDGRVNWGYKEINFILKPNKKPAASVKVKM